MSDDDGCLNGVTPCPRCGNPMDKRPDCFHWRGDWKPGWVCGACNALWEVKGEEIEPLKGTGL